MKEIEPLCNMCGFSCVLGRPDSPARDAHGLINQTIWGGYESTPGNGHGALDDCTNYTFSLCEFCLDWLFAQFTIPVTVKWLHSHIDEEPEAWKPAIDRVAQDDWRKMKKEFQEEHDRRAIARQKRLKP